MPPFSVSRLTRRILAAPRLCRTIQAGQHADQGVHRRGRHNPELGISDDWLLGYTGTRREAEDIKAKIGKFLGYRLKLELSEHKTLITHGRTEPARFLGYEIVVLITTTPSTIGTVTAASTRRSG